MDDFEDDRDFEPPWERKEKQMEKLGGSEWTLGALLTLYQGLTDRSDRVRSSAMVSLMEIAEKNPEPVKVTSLQVMMRFLRRP